MTRITGTPIPTASHSIGIPVIGVVSVVVVSEGVVVFEVSNGGDGNRISSFTVTLSIPTTHKFPNDPIAK